MKCTTCKDKISRERQLEGYTECIDCSQTVKYSAHTVFPHKTGGYVQPVTGEQADNLKRLDRRAAGGTKKAYGQKASGSWDQWLKQYNKKKEETPKENAITVSNFFKPHKKTTEVWKNVFEMYSTRGYDRACDVVMSFYNNDDISLITKGKLMNKLAELATLSKRQRKLVASLVNQ